MKFYNRVFEMDELKTLSRAAEKQSVMVVVTGVRRVGKTELINEFFKKENGTYFFVDSQKTSHQILAEFSEILSKELKLSHLISIKTWDDFFEVLFKESESKKIIIAIDEFQRFEYAEPSLPSILQKHFDLKKKTSKLLIIISGSSFGLLKRMFIEKDAPLFQRPANIMSLKPFDFKLVCQMLDDLGIKKFEEKIELYSFFNGIPKYYERMELYEVKGSQDAMKKLLFRQEAPLAKEVENVISEEFGTESPTYYGLLTAIALGKTKANEIADYAEILQTSLPTYMYDLVELLGAVKREISITDSPRSKKSRFFLSNNFFKFWFKFVHLKKSDYELGRYEEISRNFESEKESFVGHAFEDICKEALLADDSLSKYQKIGKWWGSGVDEKGERIAAEIDIVAINSTSKEILFAGCKWRNRATTLQDLLDLKLYSGFVDWNQGKRKEEFVLFSKSGFDTKAQAYAKENGWKLFTLEHLQKLFES